MASIYRGKACGKFILLGEHFVVPSGAVDKNEEAFPALAFPLLDLECEVQVSVADHFNFSVDIPDLSARDFVQNMMSRAVYAAADSLRIDISSQPVKVHSKANFPVSRGFGSSAAFAVALTRAFDSFRHSLIDESDSGVTKATWDELLKATSNIERIFHGKPSGVDAAVILAQQPIRFQNGLIIREVVNNAADFVLVDSGNRDQCAQLIAQVGDFRVRNPDQWQKMSQAMRELINQTEINLRDGKFHNVAEAIREGHQILSELGLSNSLIEEIIAAGIEGGALAGKVSGAGGGGAVLLQTLPGATAQVAKYLEQKGYRVIAEYKK